MRWTIVAPTCDLMSSPMIGRPAFSKRSLQYFSRAMKTGMQLTKAQPACERLLDVPLGRLLGADGQVVDEDVGLRLLEDADDVGGRAGGLRDDLAEVLAEAVVRHAAVHRARPCAARRRT